MARHKTTKDISKSNTQIVRETYRCYDSNVKHTKNDPKHLKAKRFFDHMPNYNVGGAK